MMAYDCKLCHTNFIQGYRYDVTLEDVLIVVFVCKDCHKEDEKEMARIIKRKVLN